MISVSELLAASTATESLTLDHMCFPESALHSFRTALYHSSGPGYILIKNYISEDQVEHLRTIWREPAATRHCRKFRAKTDFALGCPNFHFEDAASTVFYNFLWAPPIDELSYTIACYIQMLRNQLEGRHPFDEFLPTAGRALSFRVVTTRSKHGNVKFHRDFCDPTNRFDRSRYDLRRLQATLILSRHGQDYEGDGFVFADNHDQRRVVGKDIDAAPGDLMLWHQTNEHGVVNILSRPDQLGYMRMLFPSECIYSRPERKRSLPYRITRKLYRLVRSRISSTN